MSKISRRTLAERKRWQKNPDMLVTTSLRRSYEALLDKKVPQDMPSKFWTEFFSLWMVSKTLSLFGQQDDGLVKRPPDLCVGQWTDYQNAKPWDGGTSLKVFLAVAFCRHNETEKIVKKSLGDWAYNYLIGICHKYAAFSAEEQNRLLNGEDDWDAKCIYPREYKVTVWAAITKFDMISIYQCELRYVDNGYGKKYVASFWMVPVEKRECTGLVRAWFHPAKDGIFLRQLMSRLIKVLRFERYADTFDHVKGGKPSLTSVAEMCRFQILRVLEFLAPGKLEHYAFSQLAAPEVTGTTSRTSTSQLPVPVIPVRHTQAASGSHGVPMIPKSRYSSCVA